MKWREREELTERTLYALEHAFDSWKMHLGTVRRWFLLLQNLTRTIIVFSS